MTSLIHANIDAKSINDDKAQEWMQEIANVYADVRGDI